MESVLVKENKLVKLLNVRIAKFLDEMDDGDEMMDIIKERDTFLMKDDELNMYMKTNYYVRCKVLEGVNCYMKLLQLKRISMAFNDAINIYCRSDVQLFPKSYANNCPRFIRMQLQFINKIKKIDDIDTIVYNIPQISSHDEKKI